MNTVKKRKSWHSCSYSIIGEAKKDCLNVKAGAPDVHLFSVSSAINFFGHNVPQISLFMFSALGGLFHVTGRFPMGDP